MADQRRMAQGSTVTQDREARGEGRDAKQERDKEREARDKDRAIKEVRSSDIEPYTGLRYLSKLFRFMAVILVMLLVAEVATGVYTQGSAAIPTLLGEASRLIVLAGVLWGTGDLAHLLIDVGHDVRAARILVARVAYLAKVPPLIPNGSEMNAGQQTRSDAPFSDRPVPQRSLGAYVGDNDDDGPPIR